MLINNDILGEQWEAEPEVRHQNPVSVLGLRSSLALSGSSK
jgi:hypothetical protein